MNTMKTRLSALLLAVLLLVGCGQDFQPWGMDASSAGSTYTVTLDSIPEYSGSAYVVLDNNQPDFTEDDRNAGIFENYSPLDDLGRCGVAFANVGLELMPTEARGSIGMVKPSGWHTVRYDDLVDGKYLYNRCHLIGYQLAGENANECNLITGTRYLNVVGMLPFENQVADYVHQTENHVLYRVTPLFQGSDLVARGVQMEAWSLEDEGAGVCFNVFVYNVQPGVTIDYATGDSWRTEDGAEPQESQELPEEIPEEVPEEADTNVPEDNLDDSTAQESQETAQSYVLNTKSKRFHLPDCSGAASINENNRQDYTGTRADLIDQGYSPCGICKP
jgi:DNA-entry nuclease